MPSQPTVLLFDIDGTLLLSGGAGRRSFERAFSQVTGSVDVLREFSFGGMTDHGIVRLGLEKLARAVDADTVQRLFESYLEALADELPRTPKFVIMPGVHALIDKLSGVDNVALGLGTGNLKRGAEAKLRHAKLWHPFTFGGFGCDHEVRSELLRIGAERGAAQLGRPLSACRVVVIGDTIRDVSAAHAIGAECVAVETGGVSRQVLQEAGAKVVYSDLTDPEVLEVLLEG
ncbi:MAG: Hydrolase, haloacid dehalogenase-like family protein [Myxococcaceae bacterium]|nr:Hydrolase, haloacid dehalogenase-like family protein [Myxococcaceae bacterium]